MKKFIYSFFLTSLLVFATSTSFASAASVPKDKIAVEEEVTEHPIIVPKIRKVADSTNNNMIVPFGAGEWDYLGYSSFKSQSKVFYSGGGDLLIYITQPRSGGAKWLYKLYEEDPAWSWAISSFELPNEAGTFEVTFDVRDAVDGDNNKAELYLSKLTYPFDSVETEWYD
nr:hypothetical protein [Heyndrickxia oleronia]